MWAQALSDSSGFKASSTEPREPFPESAEPSAIQSAWVLLLPRTDGLTIPLQGLSHSREGSELIPPPVLLQELYSQVSKFPLRT